MVFVTVHVILILESVPLRHRIDPPRSGRPRGYLHQDNPTVVSHASYMLYKLVDCVKISKRILYNKMKRVLILKKNLLLFGIWIPPNYSFVIYVKCLSDPANHSFGWALVSPTPMFCYFSLLRSGWTPPDPQLFPLCLCDIHPLSVQ